MSTAILKRPAERPHTSNPTLVNLTDTPKEKLAALVAKHWDEGLDKPVCTLRRGEYFEFDQAAGEKNGHAGLTYKIVLGRENPQEKVVAHCSCASKVICKHIATAYLEALELRRWHQRFCPCGIEFETSLADQELCFTCQTAQEPPARPPRRGAGQDNTCHHCHKIGDESQCLWTGPDGSKYYAHGSCERKARTAGREAAHV
jgi:hypothetical protein